MAKEAGSRWPIKQQQHTVLYNISYCNMHTSSYYASLLLRRMHNTARVIIIIRGRIMHNNHTTRRICHLA